MSIRSLLCALCCVSCHASGPPSASPDAERTTEVGTPADGTSATPSSPSEPDSTSASGGPNIPAGSIHRSELVRATKGGKPAYLLRQLQPEVHRPDGRFQGWKINQVFPDDRELCARGCDLQPGDIILSVNGSPLERPEQLSKLLEQIPSIEQLEIRSIRDGKYRERNYPIVDG